MKIKISEATNEQLNWLVAKALGYTVIIEHGRVGSEAFRGENWGSRYLARFSPTTDPAQSQPIIDRDRICVNAYLNPSDGWNACVYIDRARHHHLNGPTPLIAAMRCYVALKLGDEVEVPDELITQHAK